MAKSKPKKKRGRPTKTPDSERVKELEEELEDLQREGDEENIRKWFIGIIGAVPKELWFGLLLSWMWSRTHKGMINAGDFLLGMPAGFMLGPALSGGFLANTGALAYLGLLGWNLFDDALVGKIGEMVEAQAAEDAPTIEAIRAALLRPPFGSGLVRPIKEIFPDD